jgi:chromatin segregation and condensation protein Rec8/ScpA/Scc1 (kleisin family)
MYFRFGAAVVLAVLVAVAGIAIEKRCLMLRRALTREHYRYEVLRDLYARQRLQTQQLGAPARLFEALESDRRELIARRSSDSRRQQVASEPSTSTRE